MKVFEKNVTIELLPATVLQVDKYARTGPFIDTMFFPFIVNYMYTNIVFQLQQTGKTLPIDIRDLQTSLYTRQKVDIIRANQFVIGYVDIKNEEYYYITNDFCKALGIKFLNLFTWLISIAGTVTILIAIENNYAALFACMLVILIWSAHFIIKFILNKKIENAIDERMKTFSIF